MDQASGTGRDVRDLDDPALAALIAPALGPLFRRPARLGVDSAWYGHVPFAGWIVRAARPRVIVELGTHAGVSYAAFCEAVLQERLDARCYAIDTWEGDEHAGFYGESVFEELREFHDARYGGFSRLIRCAFDAALPQIADNSVDLLHIDGRHRYDDVAHDFASWLPKLSTRGIVLFHDTNVREREFGVWRRWEELRARFPGFEFLHAHGLGVLAVGDAVPPAVAALCATRDPSAVSAVRERFALLGERWVLMQDLADARRARTSSDAARLRAEARAAELGVSRPAGRSLALALAEARNRVAILEQELAATNDRLAAQRAALTEMRQVEMSGWRARAIAAEERRDTLGKCLGVADERARTSRQRLGMSDHRLRMVEAELAAVSLSHEAMTRSISWRLTRPLRWARSMIHRPPVDARIAPAMDAHEGELETPEVQEPAPPPDHAEPAAVAVSAPLARLPEPTALLPESREPALAPIGVLPRILFISGEPTTPGHHYRVLRPMRLAKAIGWRADWSEVAPVGPHTLADARVVVLWRVTWSPHVQGIIEACAEIGARLVFDVDDLMFKPELARVEVIDGIRSAGHTESSTWTFFELIRRALDASALCVCPTEELADHAREIGRTAFVLPNGFDEASHARARQAARAVRIGDQDGLVRIGYAAGSRTHQRDFAVAAGAVARVLRERSHARLTLFRDPNGGEGVVLLNEFPALTGLEARIEWRDMVPLDGLPDELARFDINLAPLETGNQFCEAKSELKYFEAALADVPTVASPTGPMRRAIRDGETGFLAETEEQWHAAILALVDDAARRRSVGRNAYHDVLWRYGPARREELMRALLRQIEGGRDGARAFELELRRQAEPPGSPPVVPESEELFAADTLGAAEVTVIIPVYNYEGVVIEALESVRLQTLEPLDLVVVDDGSTDDSAGLVLEWAQRHAGRFNRLIVRRHGVNAGLGFARNTGFSAAETPFVLPLDADNRLRPACCATLLERLRASRASFAYPALQQFGDKGAVFNDTPYSPGRLVTGNYIDAMALIAKWAWAAAGGYDHVRFGWEDYDFWCRLVELGQWGEHVPEVLAEYRVHKTSMLASSTDKHGNKGQLIADMHRRHPWLRIAAPG